MINPNPNLKVIDSPFHHMVIHNFLDLDQASPSLEALAEQEFTPTESDLFSYSASSNLSISDNPDIKSLYSSMCSNAWVRKLESLFDLSLSGNVDMAAYVYVNGDFLLPHDDELDSRLLAYSLHLTPNMSLSDGGSFDFFSSNTEGEAKEIVKQVVPKFNSIVIFKVTPESWHQVSEILSDVQRFSLTGWYHG